MTSQDHPRPPSSEGWLRITPAMAAGVADHVLGGFGPIGGITYHYPPLLIADRLSALYAKFTGGRCLTYIDTEGGPGACGKRKKHGSSREERVMKGFEEAKAKLDWVLRYCKADVQAELSTDFSDGKYKITFRKADKQYRTQIP